MALKVKWSKNARNRYSEIINYLFSNWTEREVSAFMDRTDEVLQTIVEHPRLSSSPLVETHVKQLLANKTHFYTA
jgi:plasmid stabilization system protein ParE